MKTLKISILLIAGLAIALNIQAQSTAYREPHIKFKTQNLKLS